jgi:hypothetical protein
MNGPQPACSPDRSRGHAPAHDPGRRPAAFIHQHTMGEVSQAQPWSPHLNGGTAGTQGLERQRLVAVAGGNTGLPILRW